MGLRLALTAWRVPVRRARRGSRVALVLGFIVSACTSPDVIRTDLTTQAGGYVVGYTGNAALRHTFEDRLVADLRARGMTAFPSYPDLPDISTATRDSVARAANEKHVVAIIVINQVMADENRAIGNPARVSPDHPDLQAFYDYTRRVEAEYDPEEVGFAEVNLFFVDGAKTRLAWSGTTWSFQDGAGGAIAGISENIARQLEEARAAFFDR